VHQFEIMPKAFANFSPGFEHRENPGTQFRIVTNPEGVRRLANPFRVQFLFNILIPGLSLRSNAWAEISERLRRILVKFSN